MNLEIVVLAAGQGKSMRSGQPKGLHEIAGKPLLLYIATAQLADAAGRQRTLEELRKRRR